MSRRHGVRYRAIAMKHGVVPRRVHSELNLMSIAEPPGNYYGDQYEGDQASAEPQTSVHPAYR